MWCMCHQFCAARAALREAHFDHSGEASAVTLGRGGTRVAWQMHSPSLIAACAELTHTPHRELRSGRTNGDVSRHGWIWVGDS
jgi:hypothetical protein